MKIRQPIVSVLGHVDHGKTTLLDWIRSSSVASREAGGITQHIGATSVPVKYIKQHCSELLKKWNIMVNIPGLLFIDTPGHHAFTNLRKRGGALSDIAILIVSCNEGFQPQTYEAIDILKTYKTPFVVAMNKIDTIHQWNSKKPGMCFIESFNTQNSEVQTMLDTKLYELVGKLHELGFESERFDRVTNFRKQVAIVPISALTGEGVADLLVVLTGLCQQFLEKNLCISENEPAKGTVLEVKEERGLGITVDAIIYDGVMRRGDTIVIGGRDAPVVTRIRALLEPRELDEIRDPKKRFNNVKEVVAAAGVKIAAPGLDNIIAGVPIRVVRDKNKIPGIIKELKEEISELTIDSGEVGVVIRTDTLGTLEALVSVMKQKNIPIRFADVGAITRRDVIEAEQTAKQNKYLGVIFGFNIKPSVDIESIASDKNVKIFSNPVIYKLIEEYEEWVEEKKKEERMRLLNSVTRPGKIRVLPGYVFRQNNPAVVGVEVLGGIIKSGYPLMTASGIKIGKIKEIQCKSETISEAKEKDEVAISIPEAKVGKHFDEGDILYTDITGNDYKIIKKIMDVIEGTEKTVLSEIVEIKKSKDALWGLR